MTQLWFSFYSGFSGTMFNDDMTPSCFNLIFTVFPPFVMAMLDRPYTREIAKLCPEIYLRDCFNFRIFCVYFGHGLITSIVIFFGSVYLTDSYELANGNTLGFASSFTVMVTSVMFAVIIKAMLDTREWTSIAIFFFAFSICSWFFFSIIYTLNPEALGGLQAFFSVSKQWRVRSTPEVIFEEPIFWFICILLGVGATIPEMLVRWYLREYHRTKEDFVQEIEKDEEAYIEFTDKLRQARKRKLAHTVETNSGLVPNDGDYHTDVSKDALKVRPAPMSDDDLRLGPNDSTMKSNSDKVMKSLNIGLKNPFGQKEYAKEGSNPEGPKRYKKRSPDPAHSSVPTQTNYPFIR